MSNQQALIKQLNDTISNIAYNPWYTGTVRAEVLPLHNEDVRLCVVNGTGTVRKVLAKGLTAVVETLTANGGTVLSLRVRGDISTD